LGSVVALRQERLKLLIAYSTLAQIGYLFLMFPLAFNADAGRIERGGAMAGGLLQAISHATAKAAMFMSAGLIYSALGHDRIAGLRGVGRVLPLSVLAFALGGLALVGVPGSGASLAKDLLLQAASATGQWWWDVVIQAGGVFTSAYLFLVLVHALSSTDEPVTLRAPVPRIQEVATLALALSSLLLGLVDWSPYLPIAPGSLSRSLDLDAVPKTLAPILAGAVLAILLGRWGDQEAGRPYGKFLASVVGPARRATLAVGGVVERTDGLLRQWPAAGLSLLALALLFGAAMFLV
jgi:NADH:ubiquinone oxidoreductase subunit 5 (subunit L)/multisubunit Na+/H+ antiporter MnhA subunit